MKPRISYQRHSGNSEVREEKSVPFQFWNRQILEKCEETEGLLLDYQLDVPAKFKERQCLTHKNVYQNSVNRERQKTYSSYFEKARSSTRIDVSYWITLPQKTKGEALPLACL